ncbi:hypothetical protein VT84_13810 [Gemmata sp. SH-PL17]|uniref:hypothetical protein n=1 Tax=Gemmata sp. SH-PL17 TaxID=1630693 RepID=UPI00078DAF48|nr:hypothetical protein [Gemmata sp. SH-PL17]AMV25469.1 hypothetical protein VT84_13810 [Gemmata sp. SH-PL17]
MYSPGSGSHLYVVQIRFGKKYREHVGSYQSHDFYDAKDFAFRVDRWLKRDFAFDLPPEVISLPDELAAAGVPPRLCVVEVLALREVAPGRYDTNGEVMCQVHDITDDDDCDELEDTAIISDQERRGELVMVTAEVR